MLVRLVVERGALPETYAPFIPGAPFEYHFGFHAFVAAVAWCSGVSDPFDLARLVLFVGQLLGALVPLSMYVAGRALFGSRRAGVAAAALATLVSWFPAYYAAWGRFTQVAAILLMAPLAALLAGAARRGPGREALLAGLLSAALFLTHVRFAFVTALFLAVLFVFLAVRRTGGLVRSWAVAAGVALLLSAPWLERLASIGSVGRTTNALTGEAWRAYNAVPVDFLLAPWNRSLFALATGGLTGLLGLGDPPVWGRALAAAWVLGLALLLLRRGGARSRFPAAALALLAGASGLVALLSNLDRLGLPPFRVVPNSVGAMLLFLPASLAGAGLAVWAVRRALPGRAGNALLALGVSAVSVGGAVSMRKVVAPVTLLATAADVRALAWVRANVSFDARFAVRATPWVGGTYAGADGGYWLSVLTDRASVLPPALYPSTRDGEARRRLEATLAALSEAESLDDPALRARLRSDGVTHVFLGERLARPAAEALDGRPFLRPLYRDGSVRVFELLSP